MMRLMAFTRAAAAAAAVLLLGFPARAQGTTPGPEVRALVPYKDITLGLDASSPRIALSASAAQLPELVWAFAAGPCGDERWGAVSGDALAAANVAAHAGEGRRYWVSTGGEAHGFRCDTLAGLRAFVARYDSPLLQGLDFDIERDQSAAQIDDLVRHAAALAAERPALRFMFTLATHAASDGSGANLNATGEQVMTALRRHRFDTAIVNLMVMNYGPGSTANCVPLPSGAGCDMARSARQALANFQARHGWPTARIALTPMLGENDVANNVFTPDDAAALLTLAREAGLFRVFAWSLDRDAPCPAGEPRVSPRCHGLAGVAAGQFFQRTR